MNHENCISTPTLPPQPPVGLATVSEVLAVVESLPGAPLAGGRIAPAEPGTIGPVLIGVHVDLHEDNFPRRSR